jgi:hypothetical protein
MRHHCSLPFVRLHTNCRYLQENNVSVDKQQARRIALYLVHSVHMSTTVRSPANVSYTACATDENLINEGVSKSKVLTALFIADGITHTARLKQRYQAADLLERAAMEAATKAAICKLRDSGVRKPHTPGRKLVPLNSSAAATPSM